MARIALVVVFGASVLFGQVGESFESLTASTGGSTLTGQGPGAGYYLPAGTVSTDFQVYTFANNTLGIPQSPVGSCQFVAGTGPGGGTYARAQIDQAFPAGAQLTCGFDICVGAFTGALPATQNIGSFSMQPFPGGQTFIALARWNDLNTATTWDADLVYFDSAGAQILGQVPDPGFQNLLVNNWYRWEIDIDLTTNQITAIRLADYAAGTGPGYTPTGWYLDGGMAGNPTPTGYRLFAGGGSAGNTLAFDNICIDAVGFCLSPIPNLPDWQINQPGASMSIVGQTDGGFCAPAINTVMAGTAFQLAFSSTTNVGNPWDVATTMGPLVSASAGGVYTADGEPVNVNLQDPTLSFLFSQFQSPGFISYNQGVNIPAPGQIRAQMAIVDPTAFSGFRLSQSIDLQIL